MLAAFATLTLGCGLSWDDTDQLQPRLLLYAAPQRVDPTGQTLSLIGAKARHDDAATLCLRLSAERGTLSFPGGSEEATQPLTGVADGGDQEQDGGMKGAADASPPTPISCLAPRCLLIRMPDQQEIPAYAVYRSEAAANRNDLVLGSLYGTACPPPIGTVPLAVGQIELGLNPVLFTPPPAPVDAGVDAPADDAPTDGGAVETGPPVDAGGVDAGAEGGQ